MRKTKYNSTGYFWKRVATCIYREYGLRKANQQQCSANELEYVHNICTTTTTGICTTSIYAMIFQAPMRKNDLCLTTNVSSILDCSSGPLKSTAHS